MSDESNVQKELLDLKATAIDPSFLDRLEAATSGTLTELNAEEIRFENELRGFAPAAIAPDFMARMEGVVQNVPFPVDEKIVLFPKSKDVQRTQKKRRMPWAAAAAVALVGGVSALLLPAGRNDAAQDLADANANAQQGMVGQKFTPASFNRDLSELSEEGIIWKNNNQPHRVMRVVYKDQVTLKDEAGRTYQVEQPNVEYMLVPAETN